MLNGFRNHCGVWIRRLKNEDGRLRATCARPGRTPPAHVRPPTPCALRLCHLASSRRSARACAASTDDAHRRPCGRQHNSADDDPAPSPGVGQPPKRGRWARPSVPTCRTTALGSNLWRWGLGAMLGSQIWIRSVPKDLGNKLGLPPLAVVSTKGLVARLCCDW